MVGAVDADQLVGKLGNIGSVETYVSLPEEEYPKDKAVIILTGALAVQAGFAWVTRALNVTTRCLRPWTRQYQASGTQHIVSHGHNLC